MHVAAAPVLVRSPGSLQAVPLGPGFPRWQGVPAAVTCLDLLSDEEEDVEDDEDDPVPVPPLRPLRGAAAEQDDPVPVPPLRPITRPAAEQDDPVPVQPVRPLGAPLAQPAAGVGPQPPQAPAAGGSPRKAWVPGTLSAWSSRRLRDDPGVRTLAAPAQEAERWVFPALPSSSSAAPAPATATGAAHAENDENEDEEAADASRFATFRRSSVVAGGRDHPDPLCEPHAVRDTQPEPLGPEDDVRVPQRIVDQGFLSSTQLEAVALAARRFRRRLPGGPRAGFLLGDGTGCGKGRCIAALILDQWNRGARRHVWVSATADLYSDAIRDLRDLGADIPCCTLSRVKSYGALDSLGMNAEVRKLGKRCDGVLFCTYAMLVSARSKSPESHTDPGASRFGQVLSWLTHRSSETKGEGLICFDEAHKAKNLDQNTKVARLVDELQQRCPGCAVLYASATGATEVGHMQYMSRLGLWGERGGGEGGEGEERPPFEDFERFRTLVVRGGMPAMELVAVQLKSMGALACRSLAFEGTTFDLATVRLSDVARKQYDDSCELWRDMRRMMELACEQGLAKKTLRAEFWAAQQRFFKGLVVAAKVPDAVRLTNEALQRGESVVISLWTTNESVTARAAQAAEGDDLQDVDGFASGPELIVEQFLERHFPTVSAAGAAITWAVEAIQGFKARVRSLALPPNPIDELTERLGGSEAVAEMSGRSHRQVLDPVTGEVRSEPRRGPARQKGRAPAGGEILVDSVNIAEQRAFQSGRKCVAIITEAASAGISLHADRREIKDGTPARRRRMLSLELPWAADKAVQQLGRVHRSNQVHAPAFTCVVSDVGGEARFVSAVTRRLRQLGAMTRGDRQAGLGTSGDAFGFGKLDLMSGPYGAKALGCVLQEVSRQSTIVPPPSESGWPGGTFREFATDAKRELEEQELVLEESAALKKGGLKRFLNRLLGVSASIQSGLVCALSAHVTRLEEADREAGILDEGVVSLNRHGRFGRLRRVEELSSERLCATRGREMHLRRLRLDRGLSWEAAQAMLAAAAPDEHGCQGVYMRPLDHAASEPLIVLRRRARLGHAEYVLHYPHVPSSGLLEGLVCTAARLRSSRLLCCESPEDLAEAEHSWRCQYENSETQCIHAQRHRACNQPGCMMGKRCFEETMLTGQILAQWDLVSDAIGGLSRSPLVRTQLGDGRILVGLLLPAGAEPGLRQALERREAVDRQRSEEAAARAKQMAGEAAHSDSDSFLDVPSDGEGLWPSGGARGSDAEGEGLVSVTRVAPPAWAQGPLAKRTRLEASAVDVGSSDDEVMAVDAPAARDRRGWNGQAAPAPYPRLGLRAPAVIDVPPAPAAAPPAAVPARAVQPAQPRSVFPPRLAAPVAVDSGERKSNLLAVKARLQARLQERLGLGPPEKPGPSPPPLSSEGSGAAERGTGTPARPMDMIDAPPKYLNEVWFRKGAPRRTPDAGSDFYMRTDL